MLGTEQEVRSDERDKVLAQVESVLFGSVIGLTADDPQKSEAHHRRMKLFMRLSDTFALVFKEHWPNR